MFNLTNGFDLENVFSKFNVAEFIKVPNVTDPAVLQAA